MKGWVEPVEAQTLTVGFELDELSQFCTARIPLTDLDK
jgi:hypothetical protein